MYFLDDVSVRYWNGKRWILISNPIKEGGNVMEGNNSGWTTSSSSQPTCEREEGLWTVVIVEEVLHERKIVWDKKVAAESRDKALLIAAAESRLPFNDVHKLYSVSVRKF